MYQVKEVKIKGCSMWYVDNDGVKCSSLCETEALAKKFMARLQKDDVILNGDTDSIEWTKKELTIKDFCEAYTTAVAKEVQKHPSLLAYTPSLTGILNICAEELFGEDETEQYAGYLNSQVKASKNSARF